jgi:hypothetical protein
LRKEERVTEAYRRKNYYRPRILIDQDDVLNCPYDGVVVCLEGYELDIIRNLVAYARRRVTFVSEYHETYYLTPDTEDWDALQAIVAELEDKLMNCDEFTTLLEGILAATQCVCDKAAYSYGVSPVLIPAIEDWMDTGDLVDADTNGDTTPPDEDRCAIAQLTFALAWEVLTELLQPIQDNTFDVLMPAAMVLLAVLIGGPVLGIPVGLLTALIWRLIEVWEDGALENVQNEYQAYKDDLICAVYNGLAVDYREAESEAVEVIQSMDLSPIDMILLHCCYCPWTFMLAKKAHDNETDWATANVVPGYCWICPEIPVTNTISEDWPPCPGDYWPENGICYLNLWCFNQNNEPSEQYVQVTVDPVATLTVSADWVSCHPSGWSVGSVSFYYWDAGFSTWQSVHTFSFTNSLPAGQLNTMKNAVYNIPTPISAPYWRMDIAGQAGQGESEPYPLELGSIDVVFS